MDDLQKRISKAANFTWQSIGSDILQVAEADSLAREDVIEVVSDCDYLELAENDRNIDGIYFNIKKLFEINKDRMSR